MPLSQSGTPATAREEFPHLSTDPGRFPVGEGEDPWTAAELEELADALLADAARLETELAQADKELSELLRNSGEGAGDDQADYGSSALEREHELSVVNNMRDRQLQTLRALDRLRDGIYGACENCGGPIGKARLEAFPRVTLCVTCKAREERR